MFKGEDIGIDLGTASVLVYVKGKGIVFHEPSVLALDKNTEKIIAVGEEARKMLGRTPSNIIATRPLRDGVIADYDLTERMLRYFIKKSIKSRFLTHPRVMVCIPSRVTNVEERAVKQAVLQAGACQAFMIEEPLAAALGAGINIAEASGNMVVDIGGGTTDVAVLSLGGIVESTSIRIGGDKFDEAIIKYLRKELNLLIGERTAEEIKINIGTVFPDEKDLDKKMDVRGRDMVTGLPITASITAKETFLALQEPIESIIGAVKEVLEKTPPELSADIIEKGVVLTGGGSILKGVDRILSERTGLPVYLADNAISCVALGTGRSLGMLHVLQQSQNGKKLV